MYEKPSSAAYIYNEQQRNISISGNENSSGDVTRVVKRDDRWRHAVAQWRNQQQRQYHHLSSAASCAIA